MARAAKDRVKDVKYGIHTDPLSHSSSYIQGSFAPIHMVCFLVKKNCACGQGLSYHGDNELKNKSENCELQGHPVCLLAHQVLVL